MNDFMSIHHLFFPRKWYRSQIEQDFRELCTHKVMLPRSTHDLLHRYQDAPKMPTRGDMIHTIILHTRSCVICYGRLKRRHYLVPNNRRDQ